MYRFNNGSLYKYSEKRKAFIHVTVIPSCITCESEAIDWYEDQLRKRMNEEV